LSVSVESAACAAACRRTLCEGDVAGSAARLFSGPGTLNSEPTLKKAYNVGAGVLASNIKKERAQQYKLMLRTLDCVTRWGTLWQLAVRLMALAFGSQRRAVGSSSASAGSSGGDCGTLTHMIAVGSHLYRHCYRLLVTCLCASSVCCCPAACCNAVLLETS
jgi:hypothetical protein